jgi:hypothetical protein
VSPDRAAAYAAFRLGQAVSSPYSLEVSGREHVPPSVSIQRLAVVGASSAERGTAM